MSLDPNNTPSTPLTIREQLRAERLLLLVENTQDYAIFTMDSEGRFDSWNPGAERVLGFTSEEAIGQPVSIIFTPEDRERGVDAREMGLALAEGRAEDERWHLRKDGNRFWASGVMIPLREETGEVLGFAKILRDLTERKQAEDALKRANDELERRVLDRTAELAQTDRMRQELLHRLVTAEEQERGRISRELHDETGQYLTAFLLGLNSLRGMAIPETGQETIGRLLDIAKELGQQVHRLAFALRPTALDDMGLPAALHNYVEEWSRWSTIPTEFESTGMGSVRLPKEMETAIYRVVQEALTNVLRHGQGATQVAVALQQTAGEVLVTVEDNGAGFDADAPPLPSTSSNRRGLGIFGMRERAALVGGELTIESTPGQGTTVYLRIPLTDSEDATKSS